MLSKSRFKISYPIKKLPNKSRNKLRKRTKLVKKRAVNLLNHLNLRSQLVKKSS